MSSASPDIPEIEFPDPITVIRITDNEGVLLFEDPHDAAEHIEECLDCAVRLTDLSPDYFGVVSFSIEIIEMERAIYENSEEM